MKRCGRCKTEKDRGEFRLRSGERGRKGQRDSWCKQCRAENAVARYRSNPQRYLESHKKYRVRGGESFLSARRARRKALRANDPAGRVADSMRSRITSAMKHGGWGKRSGTATLVGCTWEELVAHIERHFKPGMTWDNYGVWHIDHHIPLSCCHGRQDGAEWAEVLNHWTNLKPLWAADNLAKGGRLPKEVFVP